jgi:hypothetical protein
VAGGILQLRKDRIRQIQHGISRLSSASECLQSKVWLRLSGERFLSGKNKKYLRAALLEVAEPLFTSLKIRLNLLIPVSLSILW